MGGWVCVIVLILWWLAIDNGVLGVCQPCQLSPHKRNVVLMHYILFQLLRKVRYHTISLHRKGVATVVLGVVWLL